MPNENPGNKFMPRADFIKYNTNNPRQVLNIIKTVEKIAVLISDTCFSLRESSR